MDEALVWLVGVLIAVAVVIYVIVWLVMMILIVSYTTVVWFANAVLAGLDVMLTIGGGVPAWLAWTLWGAVLGAGIGYASSAAAAPYRRVVLFTPLFVLLGIALVRNVV